MKLISNEIEAAEAVRNILGSRSAEEKKKAKKQQGIMEDLSNFSQAPIFIASTASQQNPPNSLNQMQNLSQQQGICFGNSLQKSAEEILSGVKRPTAVEGAVVQFVVPNKQQSPGETPRTVVFL